MDNLNSIGFDYVRANIDFNQVDNAVSTTSLPASITNFSEYDFTLLVLGGFLRMGLRSEGLQKMAVYNSTKQIFWAENSNIPQGYKNTIVPYTTTEDYEVYVKTVSGQKWKASVPANFHGNGCLGVEFVQENFDESKFDFVNPLAFDADMEWISIPYGQEPKLVLRNTGKVGASPPNTPADAYQYQYSLHEIGVSMYDKSQANAGNQLISFQSLGQEASQLNTQLTLVKYAGNYYKTTVDAAGNVLACNLLTENQVKTETPIFAHVSNNKLHIDAPFILNGIRVLDNYNQDLYSFIRNYSANNQTILFDYSSPTLTSFSQSKTTDPQLNEEIIIDLPSNTNFPINLICDRFFAKIEADNIKVPLKDDRYMYNLLPPVNTYAGTRPARTYIGQDKELRFKFIEGDQNNAIEEMIIYKLGERYVDLNGSEGPSYLPLAKYKDGKKITFNHNMATGQIAIIDTITEAMPVSGSKISWIPFTNTNGIPYQTGALKIKRNQEVQSGTELIYRFQGVNEHSENSILAGYSYQYSSVPFKEIPDYDIKVLANKDLQFTTNTTVDNISKIIFTKSSLEYRMLYLDVENSIQLTYDGYQIESEGYLYSSIGL